MSSRVTKRLTANDIGDTGGHQAGITVPKSGPMVSLFPQLNTREFNPRVTLRAIDYHTNDVFDVEFIYYNGKPLGRNTRDEYRITGLNRFFRRHGAAVGDFLRIEREDELFWLSIKRLITEDHSLISNEKRVNDDWSFGAHAEDVPRHDPSFAVEGGSQLLLSRHYERSRLNRKVAIEIHGRRCHACSFSFDEIYGPIADGYVEIHHLVPVSQMQAPKRLDPRVDLIPLCANCHRMVHREWPPVSPEKIRQIIAMNHTGRSAS